jgi:hypothetical protein
MAEYCSQCSPFNNEFDIDLFNIALNLEKGHSESFICEGCYNRGIYKDENGNLFLAKQEQIEIKLHPVKVEDLMY